MYTLSPCLFRQASKCQSVGSVGMRRCASFTSTLNPNFLPGLCASCRSTCLTSGAAGALSWSLTQMLRLTGTPCVPSNSNPDSGAPQFNWLECLLHFLYSWLRNWPLSGREPQWDCPPSCWSCSFVVYHMDLCLLLWANRHVAVSVLQTRLVVQHYPELVNDHVQVCKLPGVLGLLES